MADSQYENLGLIVDAVLEDFKESTNTIIVAQVKRWANDAVSSWARRKKRDFLNKTFHLDMEDKVESTFTVTNGSASVTHSGTASLPFTSTNGHKFWVQGYNEVYEIAGIGTATLTLANSFKGTSSTSATGVLVQSTVNLDSSIKNLFKVYHEFSSRAVEQKGVEDFRSEVQKNPYICDYAEIYSIFGYDLSAGSDQKQLPIYPYPNVAYTLHVDANIYVEQMVDDDDTPMLPLQQRDLIYWYCMWKLAEYHEDTRAPLYQQNFESWVLSTDGEVTPERQLPYINLDKDRWISRTTRGRNKIRFD